MEFRHDPTSTRVTVAAAGVFHSDAPLSQVQMCSQPREGCQPHQLARRSGRFHSRMSRYSDSGSLKLVIRLRNAGGSSEGLVQSAVIGGAEFLSAVFG